MRLFLVGGLVVLSGCPIGSSPDASVNVDPLSTHCDAVARAQCEWRQRCGVQSTQVPCAPLQTDCAEFFRPLIDAGVMRFDPDASSACIAQWAGQSCQPSPDVFWQFGPGPCSVVFVGVAGEGAQCGLCAPGFACNALRGTCGVCVPDTSQRYRYPVGGEPCYSPAVDGPGCAAGFACLYMDGGSFCDPVAALGQSCEVHACDFGANCAPDDGGATCQPYRELGEACDDQHRCKSALICVGVLCSPARVPGEACNSPFDCASFRCENGVCAPGVVGVGESCATSSCPSGAYCGTNSICVARLARSGACSADQQCELGSDCAQGTCRNPSIDCR